VSGCGGALREGFFDLGHQVGRCAPLLAVVAVASFDHAGGLELRYGASHDRLVFVVVKVKENFEHHESAGSIAIEALSHPRETDGDRVERALRTGPND
jgi:hypothetical protein